MTQEDKRYLQGKLCHERDKELLLKDLCARLPYGLYIQDEYGDIVYISYNDIHFANYFDSILNETIKPYLFPLSSMTEEQKKELEDILIKLNLKALSDEIGSEAVASYEIDFYNKYHFDYRGLIEKTLALDATGLNIY